jgi:hypothetical protein
METIKWAQAFDMDFSAPKKNARADVSVCRAFLSGLD